ncbi:VRR-NUC domain-containing protein [Gordonia otitidis]|uniref:VRR-NUC domain-containing protein n=1 Tax=Gordonia otitidis TaxID=249058 RepID=UPI001D15CBF0|nr:VRR-NUC domain-containing protein [Gordonia otitidis]UEA60686.1 VRR-NUC domain-containing protein [Gordonia otitidis]
MTATTPRERVIETYLRDACKARNVLCLKFVSPGHIGVPDRVLLGLDADGQPVTLFIEVKRPGGRPRPSQLHCHAELIRHGARVAVVDTKAGVDELLDAAFGPAGRDDRTARSVDRIKGVAVVAAMGTSTKGGPR